MARQQRIRGDYQTPPALARAICERLWLEGPEPAAVLEPTCGDGAFLVAAAEAFPAAQLHGYDLDEAHLARARAATGGRAQLHQGDAFTLPWEQIVAALPQPLLVLGNPPWVTSAALGRLNADARPARAVPAGVAGLDALTGRSNFDVSEWILRRLLAALAGRDFRLAMLCKLAVARKLIATCPELGGQLRAIDAMAAFGASVAATLMIAQPGGEWREYDSLDATAPLRRLAVIDGHLVADADAAARTAHLAGHAVPPWRSGVKHDCADVLELEITGGVLRNRAGLAVDIEEEVVFPLLKGGDLAAGRLDAPRALLLPQRRLGEDTAELRGRAPRAWAYLETHAAAFAGRRSRIYRDRAPFSVFGIGDYSFAPWKVAIAGLHKQLAFVLIGPRGGRPVLVDDTCYFLPFSDEDAARAAHSKLSSPEAAEFLNARIFWDAKRPIQKAVLDRLDLARLR